MIYANREATRKAIRYAISKKTDTDINIKYSHKDAQLPKKNERSGIHWKNFKNALGASLLYNSCDKM